MMNTNFILSCKRAFSDVLGGVVLKIFPGGKPPDPHFHFAPISCPPHFLVTGATPGLRWTLLHGFKLLCVCVRTKMHSTLCHAIRSGPKCMAPFCYAFWSRTKTHKRTETHITPESLYLSKETLGYIPFL